jgi:phosphatidylinositol-3,4,5-trisphosphate 3-phosphatase and dual-specificity protein phosphatase PTEN
MQQLRSSEKRYSDIWISLSRYNDELVDTLEQWEKYTRDGSDITRRKPGTDSLPQDKDGKYGVGKLFDTGKWDEGKMVRSFSRLGAASSGDVVESKEGVSSLFRIKIPPFQTCAGINFLRFCQSMRIFTHVLHPLPHAEWINISREVSEPNPTPPDGDSESGDSASMISEGEDAKISQSEVDDEGIVIDANREIRAKLYMDQVRFARGSLAQSMLTPLPA